MAGFLTALPDTDKWSNDAITVFSEQEYETDSGSLVTLKTIFKDLYVAYKDNLKSWWELKSIENYISNKIVPKGLRVNISPAERSRSVELIEKWEKEALSSSLRFMQILLEEEKRVYENSSKNLKEITDKALKFKGEPEFAKKETALQTSVEKFYCLLKERKHKQFLRDLNDFKEKRAFSFTKDKSERATDLSSSDFESSDSERRREGGFYRGRGSRRAWGKKRGQKWRGNYGGNYGGNYQPSGAMSLPSSSVPPYPVGIPPAQNSSSSASSESFLEAQGPPYQLRTRPR